MDTHEYLRYFEKKYRRRLECRNKYMDYSDRYNGFKKIFEVLLNKKQKDFTIIETGTLREANSWTDGQSTFIFYDFINTFGGKLISIDVNQEALDFSARFVGRHIRSSGLARLECVQGDSVGVLNSISEPADLVYLDSLDVDKDCDKGMSHALLEMVSLRRIISISPGLLVAVDDNWDGIGKGYYPLCWAKATGQEILYEGYQILFRIRDFS